MRDPARCPACNSDRIEPAFTAQDWALGAAPGEFGYVRCVACRSVFATPQPSDEVLALAYGSSYGNYQPGRTLVERIAEPLARREATRLAALADVTMPFLDLGAGTGRFLERIQRAGWTGPVRGVEYSPDVAAATSAELGVPVEPGTAEDADLGDEPNGVIVLRHVIEHLRDPRAVLERLRGGLAPDGLLYLATPDAHALSARMFGRYWWGNEVPRHLVIFSRDGLRHLVVASGFDIVTEWWSFAPQMWNASLGLALDKGRRKPWVARTTHLLNPVVTGPAVVAGALEVALRRSTMYGLVARPRATG